MNLTSGEVKSTFVKYCDEFGKLFIPGPNDDGVLDNLCRFYRKNYDADLLEESIRLYIKGSVEETIQIYEFAIVSGKMREKALEERKDRKEIAELMKQTQQRMETISEL